MTLQEFLDLKQVTPSELEKLRVLVALPENLGWSKSQWCRRKSGRNKFSWSEQRAIEFLIQEIRRNK